MTRVCQAGAPAPVRFPAPPAAVCDDGGHARALRSTPEESRQSRRRRRRCGLRRRLRGPVLPPAPGHGARASAGDAPDARPPGLRHPHGRRAAQEARWLQSLAGLRPDFVVNTGDNLSDPEGVPEVLDALGPLMEFPGRVRLRVERLLRPQAAQPRALPAGEGAGPARAERQRAGRRRRPQPVGGHAGRLRRGGLGGPHQHPGPAQARRRSSWR